VLLKNALPAELVTELRTVFRDIFIDCQASMAAETSRQLTVGAATRTKFWQRNARFRIFPRLTGPFASRFVLANPFALSILTETLGDGFYCKSVSSDTCLKGALRQAPHRDLDFYDGATPFGATVNIPIMHCGLHNGPLEAATSSADISRCCAMDRRPAFCIAPRPPARCGPIAHRASRIAHRASPSWRISSSRSHHR
jgi:hypothetical protein